MCSKSIISKILVFYLRESIESLQETICAGNLLSFSVELVGVDMDSVKSPSSRLGTSDFGEISWPILAKNTNVKHFLNKKSIQYLREPTESFRESIIVSLGGESLNSSNIGN